MSRSPAIKAKGRANEAGVLHSLVFVYSSLATILTNGALFTGYYLLFYEVIVYSNSGYFLLTIPYYLFALLVLASSCSATVALAYLRISRGRGSIPGVAQSPIGVALGVLVASCSCSLPLLAPTLYLIGLNAIEVSGVESFLASYQASIFEAIIAFNLLSIYYYLRLISRSGTTASRPDELRRGAPAPEASGSVVSHFALNPRGRHRMR